VKPLATGCSRSAAAGEIGDVVTVMKTIAVTAMEIRKRGLSMP